MDTATTNRLNEMDVRAFVKRILPWIASTTQLCPRSFDQRLPGNICLSDKQIEDISGHTTAAAAYSPEVNTIIWSHNLTKDEPYLRATIVHELVHYLQNMNGMSFNSSDGSLYWLEYQAYETMAKYLRDVEHVNPAKYGLAGVADYERGARMSSLNAKGL